MAIEKQMNIERIEIVGEFRRIQTKLRVDIIEDGVVIGSLPGVRLAVQSPDEDIRDLKDVHVGNATMPVPKHIKDELALISAQVWTDDVKVRYIAAKAAKRQTNDNADNL